MAKIEYLWSYYKGILIIGLAIFLLLGTGITIFKNLRRETALNLVVIDANQQTADFGGLQIGLLEMVEPDNKHAEVMIDTSASSVETDENTAKTTILLSVASDTDAVICNQGTYEQFAREGIFMDWQEVLGSEYGSYEKYMTEGILDLSKSPKWQDGEYTEYEPAYFCVLEKTERREGLSKAIRYLFPRK